MKETAPGRRLVLWLFATAWLGLTLAACGPSPATPGTAAAGIAPTGTDGGLADTKPAGPTHTAVALAATSSSEATVPITSAAPAETPSSTPSPTATVIRSTETPGATPTSRQPATSPSPTGPPQVATLPPQTVLPTNTARPQVLSFRVTPTTTFNLGDTLSVSWESVGERAELCPISGPGPVEMRCQKVPLAGSTQFVTDKEAMAYDGLGLRVTAGSSFVWSVERLHLQCQNLRRWFFEDPPPRCPADLPHESYAAGQYFEGGLMIWEEDPDDFYVFYRGKDEQGFQTFDWILETTLKPGASETNRVGEQPPPGRHEPVSGFGLVWRGEIEGVRSDVRQRLGWAIEPEFGFDTAYQCTTPSHPRLWSCFLRGPRGEVLYLHPDSTAQVRFLWEEW